MTRDSLPTLYNLNTYKQTKIMYSNVINELNSYIDKIDHILDQLVQKGKMTNKIGIEYAFVNYVLHDAIVWVVM